MEHQSAPPVIRPVFDADSWNSGYTRGYLDGRAAGEALGEQDMRDKLLRYLERLGRDLCLGVLHDAETPLAVLHEVELRLQDRG